jgi:hypothetical protein
MGTRIPVPTWFPTFSYQFGNSFALQANWPLVVASLYQLYYFALEPLAAVCLPYYIFLRRIDDVAAYLRPPAHAKRANSHSLL